MSGLLRRLTRRRPATADENRSPATASSEPVAAPAETPAEPGGGQPVPAEQPTVILPATTEQPAVPAQPLPAWSVAADQPTAFAYAAQPAPARDLPAGVDPADLAAAPAASSRRGKLRRRLRDRRPVRGLLLRDLGGFTYEVHRTAGGTAQEPQRRLAAAKAQRISALDAEVRALESRLGEPHETLLREPGIGGTCPECGELHASDAHFCSRCGTALDEKARAQRTAEAPATGSQAVVEPQPASVLWAGGPRPAPEPSQAEEEVVEPVAGDRPADHLQPLGAARGAGEGGRVARRAACDGARARDGRGAARACHGRRAGRGRPAGAGDGRRAGQAEACGQAAQAGEARAREAAGGGAQAGGGRARVARSAGRRAEARGAAERRAQAGRPADLRGQRPSRRGCPAAAELRRPARGAPGAAPVTAVETPAPATETRRCPRCGANLTPEQEWCLQCGADVSSTIAAPPSWRGPVAVVGGLFLIALIALVLALVELAGDAEQVAEQGATPTPTPTTTTVPTATPTIPPATDDGTGAATPEIADWPAGKDAWTVVLEASGTREAAEARANELAQQGIPVGILDSNQYPSLEPNKFIVFSGQYDSERAANQALTGLTSQVEGAYVRHVSPTAGAATATPAPTTAPTTTPSPTTTPPTP
jgi:septal ring-binding cell division protein DamX